MKVNRTGSHVPLPPARPQQTQGLRERQGPQERERVSAGWTAQGQARQGQTGSQPTLKPVNEGELASAAIDSMRQLAPMGVTSVDPLQLLDGVKDGRATLAIPLQPGRYKVRGVGYDVQPGTVARVQVDVKDGRIMPAVDASGRPTGRGTSVQIDPPLDLPLWVTGNGAYVQDGGGAQAAFKADLGGFFDVRIRELQSTKLSDVVRALGAANPDGRMGNFPRGMLRTDQVRFDAQVSMKDNVVNAGAARIDLAPGTNVRLSGTSRRASLDAQVNIDRATLRQGGTDVRLGPGSAHLTADYSTAPDGTMQLTTDVSNVNARIERATLERPRRRGDTDPDRLELGNATISNGSFRMDATLQSQRGSAVPQLTSSNVRLRGETEGALMGAKISVRDAQDDAQLQLGPGRFKGTLDVTPEGTKVDGSISNTVVDVRDLQTQNRNARLGIHSGRFEGDLEIRSDSTGAGEFDLQMQARKVDVRIDGYQGSANNVVDFKRIDMSGAGTININNRTGTEITGDMRVRGEVNDLQVGRQLDLAQGSVIDGRATHFHAGGDRGFELKAQANVDAAVERFDVTAAGMTANGAGRIRGDAQLEIANGEVDLVVRRGRADVRLEDGKIGNPDAALALDVAAGSNARLNLEEARFGRTTSGALSGSVRLDRGSVVDATLDQGHVTVGGRRVELEPGGSARFTFESLEARSGGGLPALKGSLSLETGLSTGDLTGLDVGGMQVAQAGAVRGRVKLDVPNVSLTPDGRVTYQNANVALDARIGDLRPGAARAAPTGARPAGVLSEQQVRSTSAAAIAGGTTAGRPTSYDPLDAARRVQNGTVELEVPVEGRVGEGYLGSADFPRGTKLKLQLEVRNGRIVPSETRAQFSKPGDAAGWVQARGAYFDAQNNLRLDLAGWRDKVLMERLPTDVDSLITRFQERGPGPSGNLDAFKFEQARVNIQNATFKPGKMNVPGGWIDVGANTRLSVQGTMNAARLTGKVELNGVDIAQGGVALKGSRGSADLDIAWRGGVATTTLNRLSLDTEYAVQKRSNGDYLELSRGRVENGRLTMEVPFHARALQAGRPANASLDIERFSGTVEGARLSTTVNGKRTQVELGRAQVEGEVHIDPDSIEVKGTVRNADVLARGLSASGAAGSADVESARMVGSGRVDFSTQRGLELEADVSSMDVKARGRGGGAEANRTRITGAGQVAWSSARGLSLEGELHVEAELSGELRTRPQAQQQRRRVQRVTVERSP